MTATILGPLTSAIVEVIGSRCLTYRDIALALNQNRTPCGHIADAQVRDAVRRQRTVFIVDRQVHPHTVSVASGF